jgi:hypothetical protein
MSREQWKEKRQDDIKRRKERIHDYLEKNRNVCIFIGALELTLHLDKVPDHEA